jgi:hypothetical protein
VNFYLYAAAIGVAISLAWVSWLFAARAVLRTYNLKPSHLLTFLQVGVVLGLIVTGFKISDYCLGILGMNTPANTIFFRRIWIAIWAVAMIASIQIFLEIRRMAAVSPNPGPVRRPPDRVRRPPSGRTR